MFPAKSWRRVLPHDLLDLFLVLGAILLEQVICFSLSRRLRVDLVQQHLDSQQNLLDRDCRFPAFFLIENA